MENLISQTLSSGSATTSKGGASLAESSGGGNGQGGVAGSGEGSSFARVLRGEMVQSTDGEGGGQNALASQGMEAGSYGAGGSLTLDDETLQQALAGELALLEETAQELQTIAVEAGTELPLDDEALVDPALLQLAMVSGQTDDEEADLGADMDDKSLPLDLLADDQLGDESEGSQEETTDDSRIATLSQAQANQQAVLANTTTESDEGLEGELEEQDEHANRLSKTLRATTANGSQSLSENGAANKSGGSVSTGEEGRQHANADQQQRDNGDRRHEFQRGIAGLKSAQGTESVGDNKGVLPGVALRERIAAGVEEAVREAMRSESSEHAVKEPSGLLKSGSSEANNVGFMRTLENGMVVSQNMQNTAGGVRVLSEAQGGASSVFVQYPVQHPEWGKAVGESIRMFVNQNLQSAEIKLNPPQLGPIDVRINVNQDQATVVISAQHGVVREALDAALPRLRDMLTEQGFSQVDVNVSQHAFAQKREQDKGFASGSGAKGAGASAGDDVIGNGESDHRTHSLSMGLIDYYA